MYRSANKFNEYAYINNCLSELSLKIHSQIETAVFFESFRPHLSMEPLRMTILLFETFETQTICFKICSLHFLNYFASKNSNIKTEISSKVSRLVEQILNNCKKVTFELCCVFLNFLKKWSKASPLFSDSFIYVSNVICAYSLNSDENRLGRSFISFAIQRQSLQADEKRLYVFVKDKFEKKLNLQIVECCDKINSLLAVIFDETTSRDSSEHEKQVENNLQLQKVQQSVIEIEIETRLTTSRDDPFLVECIMENAKTLKKIKKEIDEMRRSLLGIKFYNADVQTYHSLTNTLTKIENIEKKCMLAPHVIFEDGTLLEEIPI